MEGPVSSLDVSGQFPEPYRRPAPETGYGRLLLRLRRQVAGPCTGAVGALAAGNRAESCLVYAAAQAIEEGFRPVHLAVMPVHQAYLTPAVPTILFPFWEFPRIPDRDFGWETRHNWARVSRRASLIVTACEMTAKSFRQAGVGCPVEVLPVPIADRAFHVPPWSPDFTWRMTCRHVSWGGPPVAPGEPPAPDPFPHPGKLAVWARA